MTDVPEAESEIDLGDLLQRVAGGDAVAFRRLHDATRTRLFGLIYKTVRDAGYAEETLQEVYLEVWQKADHYEPEMGKPLSWLMMICHRRAIDRVRSEERLRRKTAVLAMFSVDIPQAGADETVLLREEHQQLRKHLSLLTHRQRESIDFVYFANLTHNETARRLGILVPTLKTRLRDGIVRLRSQIHAEA
jgi:RNA polymerase sigma-70 factor (ECF subfamily)